MTDQVAPPPAQNTPDQPAAQAKAPSAAKGIVKRLVGALVVFAVITLGGLAWKYLSGDPETAKVGDCLIGGAADDMKIVECTDAKAEHKVVGKIEGKTEAEFKAAENPCTAYATAESALWGGKDGGKGYILCLEPVKK